ncbi:hypothetical protein V2I01_23070 [Micromonospora sp. BRA006-A]|nr:hypothetical protein [Micromonospora sp. BRA006-A]
MSPSTPPAASAYRWRAGRHLRPPAYRRGGARRRALGRDQQPRRPRHPAAGDDRILRFPLTHRRPTI